MNPDVRHFYEPVTGSLTWVVADPATRKAAIVDPVLGLEMESGRLQPEPADVVLRHVEANGLQVDWILDTHAHADHLTAAQYVKARTGGRVGIGEGIRQVQAHFGPLFNLAPFPTDGSQFDHLFADGEEFTIGELQGTVLHTPGHTNDSVTYRAGRYAFVGDTLFMPDLGTARCDFPGGDAGRLYDSIQRLFGLPGDTCLCLCHDYPPDGRAPAASSGIDEQRARNIHVGRGIDRDAFVAMRTARDATLALPRLILPSIQVNVRAGHLPDAESNGVSYLRIPLDAL